MNKNKETGLKNSIEAIIIKKNGLNLDEVCNFLKKIENIEVTEVTNLKSDSNRLLKKISMSKGKDIFLIDPSDIIYFAAKAGKVTVVTKTERFLSNYPLTFWEQKLKDLFFFRCHNSYLVNLEKIKLVTPFFDNTCFIAFEGIEDKVSVSRSCIKSFRELLDI